MPCVDQQTVIFLGPQGSGKGTQITKLEEFLAQQEPTLPTVRFAAGTSLRPFSEGASYTSQLVKPILAAGELVPLFVTSGLFAQYLMEHMQGREHLIIDGFPRMQDQIADLDSAFTFYKRAKPALIHLTLSDEVAVERLVKRGRSDDTPDAIRARLRWTREQLESVLAWFRKNPEYQVLDVDAGPSVEDIHKDILNKLGLA